MSLIFVFYWFQESKFSDPSICQSHNDIIDLLSSPFQSIAGWQNTIHAPRQPMLRSHPFWDLVALSWRHCYCSFHSLQQCCFFFHCFLKHASPFYRKEIKWLKECQRKHWFTGRWKKKKVRWKGDTRMCLLRLGT